MLLKVNLMGNSPLLFNKLDRSLSQKQRVGLFQAKDSNLSGGTFNEQSVQ